MILSEIEKDIVGCLRNLKPIIAKDYKTSFEYLSVLSDEEILALYNKMDSYIEAEGKLRASLGSYDEMYVIELFSVKDKINATYKQRTGNQIFKN